MTTMPATTARQLSAFLATWAATPFDWAAAHCGHFAAAWLLLATGRHCLPPQAAAGGQRPLQRAVHAAGGLEPLVSAALGAAPRPANAAGVGDLVMLPGATTGGTLAICCGRTAACLGPDGVVHALMAQALLCWPLADIPAAASQGGAS